MMKKLIVALALTVLFGCRTVGTVVMDLEQYCREHPEECGKATPRPAPTATPVLPTTYCNLDKTCDCYVCIDSAQDRIGLGFGAPCLHPAYRACAAPTPTVTPAATPAPTATATPAATLPPPPAIDPWCVDLSTVPEAPVPIFSGISQHCRRADGFVEITAPDGVTGCQRDWDCADGNDSFRPGPRTQYSLSHGGPEGVHRCDLGEGPGPGFICDAGRRAMEAWHRQMLEGGGIHQPGPEKDGYIPKPWESTGACRPRLCASTPTPQPPIATPTPPVTASECAVAIAANGHFLVGGGGAHAWHPIEGGLVRVVLDTTWRPICDLDHMENWNNPAICGKCSHDPDYTVPEGAQLWTVEGAEDRGWNPGNSAQRIIVGRPGARVKITICPARPVIAAATGTELPIGHGDGCSRPDAWTLPGN